MCQQKDLFYWDVLNTKICQQCHEIFHRNCYDPDDCPSCLEKNNY